MLRSLFIAFVISVGAQPASAAEPPTPSQAADAPQDAQAPAPQQDAAKSPPETAPASQAAQARIISATQKGMGTNYHIQVYSADEAGAQKAIAAALAEMARIEKMMSEWQKDSDISRLNQNAGKDPVKVDEETYRVLETGQAVALASKGAFSMTWAALGGLWDFRQGKEAQLPNLADVKARLPLINDADIVFDEKNQTVKLGRQGMALGLGGIAKGYAIDRAVLILKKHGFTDVLVYAGGDLRTNGGKGDTKWVIGIQDPRADGYFASLDVGDEALATSGDYQNFFENAGKRYHHILDPKTGYPAEGCRSVTVIAKDAVRADAFATAIFVLGLNDGMALAEMTKDVEVLIVAANNELAMSSGLQKRLRLVHPPSE